jgi:N-acylglucosamine-6-phosphate 2-epimerase
MCITPTFAHAKALALAGAEIVAVDVRWNRPFGEPVEAAFAQRLGKKLGVAVLADCQTLEDAQNAQRIGVDAVAPTFGFGTNSIGTQPDFALLKADDQAWTAGNCRRRFLGTPAGSASV